VVLGEAVDQIEHALEVGGDIGIAERDAERADRAVRAEAMGDGGDAEEIDLDCGEINAARSPIRASTELTESDQDPLCRVPLPGALSKPTGWRRTLTKSRSGVYSSSITT
jgi:hypothetical protein